MLVICFDHNFNSFNRSFSDIIVPQRNFIEKKTSMFINSFKELKKLKGALVKDVESLFEFSYKKSFDFFVYDARILNFTRMRSLLQNHKMNSPVKAALKKCQFNPILFFSYEHLFNTVDNFLFKKLINDISLITPRGGNFNLNNLLLFTDKTLELFRIKWFTKNITLNLSEFVLIGNKLYFDPENDTFSNCSVLLIKTYKRIILQISNFN
jgi:hypothetical protein